MKFFFSLWFSYILQCQSSIYPFYLKLPSHDSLTLLSHYLGFFRMFEAFSPFFLLEISYPLTNEPPVTKWEISSLVYRLKGPQVTIPPFSLKVPMEGKEDGEMDDPKVHTVRFIPERLEHPAELKHPLTRLRKKMTICTSDMSKMISIK